MATYTPSNPLLLHLLCRKTTCRQGDKPSLCIIQYSTSHLVIYCDYIFTPYQPNPLILVPYTSIIPTIYIIYWTQLYWIWLHILSNPFSFHSLTLTHEGEDDGEDIGYDHLGGLWGVCHSNHDSRQSTGGRVFRGLQTGDPPRLPHYIHPLSPLKFENVVYKHMTIILSTTTLTRYQTWMMSGWMSVVPNQTLCCTSSLTLPFPLVIKQPLCCGVTLVRWPLTMLIKWFKWARLLTNPTH